MLEQPSKTALNPREFNKHVIQQISLIFEQEQERHDLSSEELSRYVIEYPPSFQAVVQGEKKQLNPGGILLVEPSAIEQTFAEKDLSLADAFKNTGLDDAVKEMLKVSQHYLGLNTVIDEFDNHQDRTVWERIVSESLDKIDRQAPQAFDDHWTGKLSVNKMTNDVGGTLEVVRMAMGFVDDPAIQKDFAILDKRYQNILGIRDEETETGIESGTARNTQLDIARKCSQIAIDIIRLATGEPITGQENWETNNLEVPEITREEIDRLKLESRNNNG